MFIRASAECSFALLSCIPVKLLPVGGGLRHLDLNLDLMAHSLRATKQRDKKEEEGDLWLCGAVMMFEWYCYVILYVCGYLFPSRLEWDQCFAYQCYNYILCVCVCVCVCV